MCASTAERASDLKDAGKLREAVRLFEACAKDACPRIVREDCRRFLADIREKGPRLLVRVEGADGKDVEGATVTLDGADLGADARARGVLVDPGSHLLRASTPGAPAVEEKVIVTATDGARPVVLTLRAPMTATKTPVAPSPPADRTPAYVAGGLGLVALGAFGVLGAWTYADYKHLSNTCSPHCEASRIDPVHTRGVVADVALGVGVAALAVAVILYVTATPGSPRPAREALLSW